MVGVVADSVVVTGQVVTVVKVIVEVSVTGTVTTLEPVVIVEYVTGQVVVVMIYRSKPLSRLDRWGENTTVEVVSTGFVVVSIVVVTPVVDLNGGGDIGDTGTVPIGVDLNGGGDMTVPIVVVLNGGGDTGVGAVPVGAVGQPCLQEVTTIVEVVRLVVVYVVEFDEYVDVTGHVVRVVYVVRLAVSVGPYGTVVL